MRTVALLACALHLACDGAATHRAAERWTSPLELAFPDTPVGERRVATLHIQNESPAAVDVQLRAPDGFVVPTSVRLDGGAAFTLAVTFAPTTAGTVTGMLHLASEALARDVRLSGTGIAPAPDPCAGVVCDDANACTKDQCAAGTCDHVTVTCPATDDPCLVSACDPLRGCVVLPAADGTVCGSGGCDEHVCRSGACVVTPLPEGVTCATASLCQGPGVCRDHVCERPEPGELTIDWEYTPPRQAQISGRTLADEEGNLLRVERWPDGATWLTSLLPGGAVRFHVQLASPPTAGYLTPPADSEIAVSEGLVLVPVGEFLEARRATDGGFVWSQDLRSLVTSPGAPEWRPRSVALFRLVADGHGRAVVFVTVPGERRPGRTWAISFSLRDRSVVWTDEWDGQVAGIADEDGNVYLADTTEVLGDRAPLKPLSSPGLWSLRPDGTERWSLSYADLPFPQVLDAWSGLGAVMAVADGALVVQIHGGLAIFDGATGTLRGYSPLTDDFFPVIPMLDGLAVRQVYGVGDSPGFVRKLSALSLRTAVEQWSLNLDPPSASRVGASLPTRAGTWVVALVSEGTSERNRYRVLEIDRFGTELGSCVVNAPSSGWFFVGAPAALVGDVLLMTRAGPELDDPDSLTAVRLPGAAGATSGWRHVRGQPAGGWHP